jgi:hypothetical protein
LADISAILMDIPVIVPGILRIFVKFVFVCFESIFAGLQVRLVLREHVCRRAILFVGGELIAKVIHVFLIGCNRGLVVVDRLLVGF